jgi:hypothetical protein
MSVQPNPWSLAEEAIGEYLLASRICVEHRKQDGGILGYPAALLLLCIVNALGTYLRGEEVVIEGKKQQITRGKPFRALNHLLFRQDLTRAQIDRIEAAFRNPLAHNALIHIGAGLTPAEAGLPFEFSNNEVWISVPMLHKIVTDAWEHFDKSKIKYAVRTFKLAS